MQPIGDVNDNRKGIQISSSQWVDRTGQRAGMQKTRGIEEKGKASPTLASH